MGIQVGALDLVNNIPAQVITTGATIVGLPFGCGKRNQVIGYVGIEFGGTITGVTIGVQFSPDMHQWYDQTFAKVSAAVAVGSTSAVPVTTLTYTFASAGTYALPVQIEYPFIRFTARGAGADGGLIAIEIGAGQV